MEEKPFVLLEFVLCTFLPFGGAPEWQLVSARFKVQKQFTVQLQLMGDLTVQIRGTGTPISAIKSLTSKYSAQLDS